MYAFEPVESILEQKGVSMSGRIMRSIIQKGISEIKINFSKTVILLFSILLAGLLISGCGKKGGGASVINNSVSTGASDGILIGDNPELSSSVSLACFLASTGSKAPLSGSAPKYRMRGARYMTVSDSGYHNGYYYSISGTASAYDSAGRLLDDSSTVTPHVIVISVNGYYGPYSFNNYIYTMDQINYSETENSLSLSFRIRSSSPVVNTVSNVSVSTNSVLTVSCYVHCDSYGNIDELRSSFSGNQSLGDSNGWRIEITFCGGLFSTSSSGKIYYQNVEQGVIVFTESGYYCRDIETGQTY